MSTFDPTETMSAAEYERRLQADLAERAEKHGLTPAQVQFAEKIGMDLREYKAYSGPNGIRTLEQHEAYVRATRKD